MDTLNFNINGYEKSEIGIENNDFQWCNIYLNFKNKIINYEVNSDILQITELKKINEGLKKCLSGELMEDKLIYFDEPDIEIYLHHNIVDKSHRVELRLIMDLDGYCDDYYSVFLYDKEINMLRDYINDFLESINQKAI